MKLDIFKSIDNLETVEEKSFWVIAPTVALLGLAGLTTSGSYGSIIPTIISAVLCLLIPVILMIFVLKYKNYHSAYPMLCICIGAISIPVTFIFGGGFFSGMPLFCVVSTCISALCYSRKWRYFALICCILGNFAAFYYVYSFGTPYPIVGESAIINDIVFGYVFASLAAFGAINMIVVEARKYRISQDALQSYFDTRVRKEITDKALKGDLALSTGHRKAAIAFIDISSFTTIAEKMSSDLIAEFLNDFFSMAGKHVHNHNGIIDKYIGDCIMVYWLQQDDNNCVEEAIRAVLDIRKEVQANAEATFTKFYTELYFSAGISYGDVIFGDFGSDTMHDYTVIGDAVNVASRLEHYAVAGELLISNNAAREAANLFELEMVDEDIYLKGKNQAISTFRVLSEKENANNLIKKPELTGYRLHVCGCRGSFPVSGLRFSEYGGETSCYVLVKEDYALIIDCGTGLKNANQYLKGVKKIDVLLTHVHYDHILGLLMAKLPTDTKIRIFGNFADWNGKNDTLAGFMEHPYWPVGLEKFATNCIVLGEPINLNENLSATFYLSDHPDHSCVIKLDCEDKKICFFADCEDANKLDPVISHNADILLFDGMFDDNDEVSHTGWGHGTWQSGLSFAKKQKIKKLIITHHNPEVGDHTLHLRESMARETFANVSFAKTGDTYLI